VSFREKEEEMEIWHPNMTMKRVQKFLMKNGPMECCPAVEMYTNPKNATDRYGNLVFLKV